MDHQNPRSVEYQSQTIVAPTVVFAQGYFLSRAQIEALEATSRLPLNDGMRYIVPMELVGRVNVQNDYLYIGNPMAPRVRCCKYKLIPSSWLASISDWRHAY